MLLSGPRENCHDSFALNPTIVVVMEEISFGQPCRGLIEKKILLRILPF